jgi:hypothetical protein
MIDRFIAALTRSCQWGTHVPQPQYAPTPPTSENRGSIGLANFHPDAKSARAPFGLRQIPGSRRGCRNPEPFNPHNCTLSGALVHRTVLSFCGATIRSNPGHFE